MYLADLPTMCLIYLSDLDSYKMYKYVYYAYNVFYLCGFVEKNHLDILYFS